VFLCPHATLPLNRLQVPTVQCQLDIELRPHGQAGLQRHDWRNHWGGPLRSCHHGRHERTCRFSEDRQGIALCYRTTDGLLTRKQLLGSPCLGVRSLPTPSLPPPPTHSHFCALVPTTRWRTATRPRPAATATMPLPPFPSPPATLRAPRLPVCDHPTSTTLPCEPACSTPSPPQTQVCGDPQALFSPRAPCSLNHTYEEALGHLSPPRTPSPPPYPRRLLAVVALVSCSAQLTPLTTAPRVAPFVLLWQIR
jgi:hypothetical protein